jgi:glycosyltransferase involved in cell wall biosynthesis
MRIELQHSFFAPIFSGQERRIHILSDELLSRGYQVSICTSRDGIDDIGRYEKKGLSFFPHPSFFSRKPKSLVDPILYSRKLRHFLRERSPEAVPDLVLAFHFAYVLASKRVWPDVPVAFLPGATIRDWHSWLTGHKSAATRAFLSLKIPAADYVEKKAVQSADRMFIETVLLKNRFSDRYSGIEHKISLWPTPVDLARFKPSRLRRDAIRKKLGIDPTTQIVLAVGRLNWNKNFSTLIKAAATLRGKDWLLLIVGQGTEEENLRRLAASLRILDRVKFLKASSEMENIYAGADVFAHPALCEPYGNVILEAMASGLPCVVSPAKQIGISCDLTGGTNALFADSANPSDWASKISSIMEDEWLAANLGNQARRFCEERPGWPALTSRLLQECGATSILEPAHAETSYEGSSGMYSSF